MLEGICHGDWDTVGPAHLDVQLRVRPGKAARPRPCQPQTLTGRCAPSLPGLARPSAAAQLLSRELKGKPALSALLCGCPLGPWLPAEGTVGTAAQCCPGCGQEDQTGPGVARGRASTEGEGRGPWVLAGLCGAPPVTTGGHY